MAGTMLYCSTGVKMAARGTTISWKGPMAALSVGVVCLVSLQFGGRESQIDSAAHSDVGSEILDSTEVTETQTTSTPAFSENTAIEEVLPLQSLPTVQVTPIEPLETEVSVQASERASVMQFVPSPKGIAALIPTPQRKWVNPEGKSVEGRVTVFDSEAETTTLETASGETLENFPLARFAAHEREYLREAAKGLLSGKVVGVHDGDSLTLLVAENTTYKIRLEAIDAPELGQEYGRRAKEALSGMVFGKSVAVQVTGRDKYERYLGFVLDDELVANQEMISQGFAWHYEEYSSDKILAQGEVNARTEKRGMWQGYNPMSPWEWRALQRSNAALARVAEVGVVQPFVSVPQKEEVEEKAAASYWLNLSGGKRHNTGCRWFGNTKRGRYCSKGEGSACGICGG